ncbi:hypothetical protein J2125_004218 [Erwinia toletana]|uniref:Uncharacterized protein n=1 Tax=Winslowiella toletana TaxID=92490 RepID=A0ABS4PG14_9GAMM|nr:hypothetical protein [Winslowiella toletana]MBP2171026.1 hypothetical protein [Winslowiella toletana]
MSTFTLIAIPFFINAVVMFIVAASSKHKAFLYAGSCFMTAAVINAAIGLSA